MPKHESFVDAMGGGANVILAKEPVKVNVYNDIYDEVYNFFYQLRNHPYELIQLIMLTPYSRMEHAESFRRDDNPSDLERARRVFVESHLSLQGIGVKNAPCNFRLYRTGNQVSFPSIACLYYYADRMRNILLERLDVLDAIDKYDSPSTLFYIDPPYLKYGDGYVCGFSLEDHIRLAKKLYGVRGYVMVSAKWSGLYEHLYDGWVWYDIPTRSLSHNVSMEHVICNYELDI